MHVSMQLQLPNDVLNYTYKNMHDKCIKIGTVMDKLLIYVILIIL